jgi:hypothetical protein
MGREQGFVEALKVSFVTVVFPKPVNALVAESPSVPVAPKPVP